MLLVSRKSLETRYPLRGPTSRYRYRDPTGERWVESKSIRYGATSDDEAQRRYAADAALFMGTGWAVHHVAWDPQAKRPTLVATYARYEEAGVEDIGSAVHGIPLVVGLIVVLLASPILIVLLFLGLQ